MNSFFSNNGLPNFSDICLVSNNCVWRRVIYFSVFMLMLSTCTCTCMSKTFECLVVPILLNIHVVCRILMTQIVMKH